MTILAHYKLLKRVSNPSFTAKPITDSPPKSNLWILPFYEPSIEIGGDYYYFMDIDNDKLGIFLPIFPVAECPLQ